MPFAIGNTAYGFFITKSANILYLRTKEDITLLQKYIIGRSVDWESFSKDYQGFFVSGEALSSPHFWGYDADSYCIFNPSILEYIDTYEVKSYSNMSKTWEVDKYPIRVVKIKKR